jgi:hypothetical protein
MNFAKLFQVDPEHQVVVLFKVQEGEKEKYTVSQIIDIDGLFVEANLGFKTEEKAQKAFQKYDEAEAKTFVESIKELIGYPV